MSRYRVVGRGFDKRGPFAEVEQRTEANALLAIVDDLGRWWTAWECDYRPFLIHKVRWSRWLPFTVTRCVFRFRPLPTRLESPPVNPLRLHPPQGPRPDRGRLDAPTFAAEGFVSRSAIGLIHAEFGPGHTLAQTSHRFCPVTSTFDTAGTP